MVCCVTGLARYQNDFAGVPCRTLSQRYYYQALTLCPELGEQQYIRSLSVFILFVLIQFDLDESRRVAPVRKMCHINPVLVYMA